MATALQYVPVSPEEAETVTMYRDVCIMSKPRCPICYQEFHEQHSVGDIIAHMRCHGDCWKSAVTRATQRTLETLSTVLAEDEDGELLSMVTLTPVPPNGGADWTCPFCEDKFPSTLEEEEFMEHVYTHDPQHEMFEDDSEALLTLVNIPERETECRMCQEDFKDCGVVRILPCGHMFCQRCLARFYDDNSEVDDDGYTQLPSVNPGDKLKCIYRCRIDEVLPPRGVVDLPQYLVPGVTHVTDDSDLRAQPAHTSSAQAPPRRWGRRCWFCGEYNHSTEDCRIRRRVTCRECGRRGHKAKHCRR